jgi:NitT/TauT family transport system substrate-binding protein
MLRVRRSLCLGILLAGLACFGAGAAAQPRPLGKVTVGLGVAKTFSFLPAYVAEDLGTWKKRGLEVEIVAFAGDARLQQGIAAGSVDFALGGVAGSLIAISKGQQTRLVGGLANSVALMGLIAHPDIKSKEDLKGKVVGVTSPNSVTDVLVRYLSKKLTGDAEGGIRRAFLGGFQSQVAALKTGQTVAFTWTLEGIYDAEKQGVGKFLLSFGDEIPDFAFEAVIATRKMIEERPEVVRAFLEGVYEAVAHMKAHKEYTVDLFLKKMDTPKDIGARVWDFDAHKLVDDGLFNDKALTTAAQAIAETGAFAEPPPLSAWVDKRFLPVTWKR